MKDLTDTLVPIAIGIGLGALWPYFGAIKLRGNQIEKAFGMMILSVVIMTGLLGVAIYLSVRG